MNAIPPCALIQPRHCHPPATVMQVCTQSTALTASTISLSPLHCSPISPHHASSSVPFLPCTLPYSILYREHSSLAGHYSPCRQHHALPYCVFTHYSYTYSIRSSDTQLIIHCPNIASLKYISTALGAHKYVCHFSYFSPTVCSIILISLSRTSSHPLRHHLCSPLPPMHKLKTKYNPS